jgi:hypothetical protein
MSLWGFPRKKIENTNVALIAKATMLAPSANSKQKPQTRIARVVPQVSERRGASQGKEQPFSAATWAMNSSLSNVVAKVRTYRSSVLEYSGAATHGAASMTRRRNSSAFELTKDSECIP